MGFVEFFDSELGVLSSPIEPTTPEQNRLFGEYWEALEQYKFIRDILIGCDRDFDNLSKRPNSRLAEIESELSVARSALMGSLERDKRYSSVFGKP